MSTRRNPSPACLTGIAAWVAAAGLWPINPLFSAAALAAFVAACLAAPFFPQTGFFFPVVSKAKNRGKNALPAIGLTFDDGPDPETTPALLALLKSRQAPATFFVTGQKAKQYPELIDAILDQGHLIGNHTDHHDPTLMLKSRKKLEQEIAATQAILERFGIRALAFRPPAGIVNPRLEPVLKAQGLFCLLYSCRGRDMGNRRIRGLSARILGKAGPGDIVLLHDVKPNSGNFQTDAWLTEVERILTGLDEKGLGIRPVSELIERPVMEIREVEGS